MPTKIEELLKSKRLEILTIAARHGAHNLRVFGSVARGEAGPESDLDILVEMEPGKSLMDHVALMQDLEDLLQTKGGCGQRKSPALVYPGPSACRGYASMKEIKSSTSY